MSTRCANCLYAMPLFLYDLPNWLFGLLISGVWVLAGLGGYLAFHRVCRVTFSEGERNLAMALLAVIATVNSLLLAFSAISVWEAFGSADKAVRNEAVTISALSRDLAVFDTAESHHARELLKKYAETVVAQEWPDMQSGHPNEVAWAAFETMFRSVGHLDPAGPREAALMPEIWARTNDLVKFRRERLYASEAQVPGTLWIVVVAATMLSLMTLFVLPRTAFHLTAVGLLSCSFGLVFFFIAAMDRPFAGTESIGSEPIKTSLLKMDQWNQETPRSKPTGALERRH